jgi:hypothetical protein
MASKRIDITTMKAKASGKVGTSARRKATTTSVDIGGIRDEHRKRVIKGVVVPKPPAPPVIARKAPKPV